MNRIPCDLTTFCDEWLEPVLGPVGLTVFAASEVDALWSITITTHAGEYVRVEVDPSRRSSVVHDPERRLQPFRPRTAQALGLQGVASTLARACARAFIERAALRLLRPVVA